MKIDITTEEYRDLLDLLYMANWVLHAHKTEEDHRTKPYDTVIQKIYSSARAAGFGPLIKYDPHDRRYYPTPEFEDSTKAVGFVDEFVDDSFWDELVFRLAERDVAHRVGGYDQLRLLGPDDRTALLTPAEERYSDEFYRNGLDHLVLAEEFGPGAGKAVKTSD
jgi:hypothetical protein